MKLSHLTKILNGQLIGNDTSFSGVSIDTRTLQKNNLYIDTRGNVPDGVKILKTFNLLNGEPSLAAYSL